MCKLMPEEHGFNRKKKVRKKPSQRLFSAALFTMGKIVKQQKARKWIIALS